MTEDKLRFFQHFVTGKAFTKEYEIGKYGKIVFRTITEADKQLIVKYEGLPKDAYFVAGIANITAVEDTTKFVPISDLEFDTQYSTPVPQLITYITELFDSFNINYATVVNLYHQDFLPLVQQLQTNFKHPNIAFDAVINNLLRLIYNNVINISELDLDNPHDRNLLGLLLSYTDSSMPKTPPATKTQSQSQSPTDLIKLYEELKEKKQNAG